MLDKAKTEYSQQGVPIALHIRLSLPKRCPLAQTSIISHDLQPESGPRDTSSTTGSQLELAEETVSSSGLKHCPDAYPSLPAFFMLYSSVTLHILLFVLFPKHAKLWSPSVTLSKQLVSSHSKRSQ